MNPDQRSAEPIGWGQGAMREFFLSFLVCEPVGASFEDFRGEMDGRD